MPKTTTPRCIVAELAEQHGRLRVLDLENTNRMEGEAIGSERYEIFQDIDSALYAAATDIREAACLHDALSLEGAVLQVSLIAWLVDELLDYTADGGPADKGAGPTREWRINTIERRIDRLVWSVRRSIEKAAGIDGDKFGLDAIMSRYCAPSRSPEEIVSFGIERLDMARNGAGVGAIE